MRSPWILLRLVLVGLLMGTCARAIAAPAPSLNGLFQSDRITAAALSPDGLRLAYAVRNGPVASIVIRSVDQASNKTTLFADVGERKGGRGRSGLTAARVLFIGWADPQTLVYAVALPAGSSPAREELHAADASGANGDRVLLTSNDIETSFVGPFPSGGSPSHDVNAAENGGDDPMDEFPASVSVSRSMRVLGFDPSLPANVLVEARGGRMAPHDVYRIDLKSGRRERLGETPGEDEVLYDGHGMPRVRETARVLLPPLGSGANFRSHLPLAVPPVTTPPQIMRQLFEYHAPTRRGFWHGLNQLTGSTAMPGFSVADGDFFRPRSFPLGFGDDPNLLYVASNVGRDTYGIYGLDLTTGKRTVVMETDGVDLAAPSQAMSAAPLVLDRMHHLAGVRIRGVLGTTHWFDPALARLQQVAEAAFTNRTVEFLDWNDAKTRVLMLVSGPGELGRYFIFDTAPLTRFREFLRVGDAGPRTAARLPFRRRAPAPLAEPAHAEPFTFTTDDGVTLHGIVTMARDPRSTPPPVVLLCPDVPGDWLLRKGVDAEAQAFAREGYLTVEVAYRGTGGFGLRHQDAIHGGYDRLPLEDIQATLRWLLPRFPYDRRRIALVGHGFGAYVALRALELAPLEFRAAAAIGVPANLPDWLNASDAPGDRAWARSESSARRRGFFEGREKDLAAISVDRDADVVRRPVLIVADLSDGPAVAKDARSLRDRLGKHGEAEYFEITGAPPDDRPDARTILRTVEFLNANVYDYRVDVGREHEVK